MALWSMLSDTIWKLTTTASYIKWPLKKIFVFCLIICSGCSDRTNDKETVLVVSNTNKVKDTEEPPLPPPSPYGYYSCFNFIVDSDGKLYFYQHFYDRRKLPVRVIDFGSNAPVFINLNPNQIVEIPDDVVKRFVEYNVLKANQAYKIVSVVGVADTIKSKVLNPLMNILTDTTNHIHYSIRKITLEEKVVFDFKKRQEYYYVDSVNWDSTKIWFERKRMK